MKKQLQLLLLTLLMISFSSHAQVKNGDMETTGNISWPWDLDVNNSGTATPGAATMTYEAHGTPETGNFLQVVVTAVNTEKPWNLRVKQGSIVVASNAIKFIFSARGTVGGELLRVRYDGDGSTKPQVDVVLTTTWEDYELVLPASSKGTTSTLSLWTQSIGTYQFDDIEADGTLSLSSSKLNNAKVWYSDSANALHIEGVTANSVRVYALSGAKVAQYDNPGNTIALGDLSSGLYIATVLSEHGTKAFKFVK